MKSTQQKYDFCGRELIMWAIWLMILGTTSTSCSVRPAVIETEPVIDQELYDIAPYEVTNGN